MYGLHPGTLKGELFRMLSEQGNNGLKISELTNAAEVSFFWKLLSAFFVY